MTGPADHLGSMDVGMTGPSVDQSGMTGPADHLGSMDVGMTGSMYVGMTGPADHSGMTGPSLDHSGMTGSMYVGMTGHVVNNSGMTGMTGSSVDHSGMTGQVVNNSGMIRPGPADLVRPSPTGLVRPGPVVDHSGRTCQVDHSGGRRARRRTDPTPNKDNQQQQNRQIQSYWHHLLKNRF